MYRGSGYLIGLSGEQVQIMGYVTQETICGETCCAIWFGSLAIHKDLVILTLVKFGGMV